MAIFFIENNFLGAADDLKTALTTALDEADFGMGDNNCSNEEPIGLTYWNASKIWDGHTLISALGGYPVVVGEKPDLLSSAKRRT